MKSVILVTVCIVMAGCDPNAEPTYGRLGLPTNCKALVQANITGWRLGQYTAAEAMGSIERHCNARGALWKGE